MIVSRSPVLGIRENFDYLQPLVLEMMSRDVTMMRRDANAYADMLHDIEIDDLCYCLHSRPNMYATI